MKIITIVLNFFFPGLGHVLSNRHITGFIHFFCFAVFFDLAFVGNKIWQGDGGSVLVITGIVGGALVWSHSLISLIYQVYFFNKDKLYEEQKHHYIQGLSYLALGKAHESRQEFREILQTDRTNISARLMICQAYKEEGQFAKALQVLKECGRFRNARDWDWEIRQLRGELGDLKTARKNAAAEKDNRK